MNGLDKIEELAASIIEGTFDRMLGKRQLILKIAQALAQEIANATANNGSGYGPLPNDYWIALNADDYQQLVQEFPQADQQLRHYLLELYTEAGFGPFEILNVRLSPVKNIDADQFFINASFPSDATTEASNTKRLRRISSPNLNQNQWLLRYGDKVYKLEGAVLQVGRALENDIVLENPTVSRHHAQLRWLGDHYLIWDLESKHGIRVNGERITQADLKSGDCIAFGDVSLSIELFSAAIIEE